MSSRAWTEVATGADARSLRRWARRATLPILVRCLVLLALVIVTVIIFGEQLPKSFGGSCGFDCIPRDPRGDETLLERLF